MFARTGLAAVLDVVLVGDNLGPDEALFEVGMDDTRALWGLPALMEGPGAHLLRAGREEAGEANAHVAALKDYASRQGAETVVICAQVEAELAGLSDEEIKERLEGFGLSESSLDRTIKLAYDTLGLASFLTTGPKESRAWTFHKGWKAPKCAGVIHTDFEKGFIRAQVVAYEDFVKYGGESGAREHGVLRPEGKEYEMKDGDVVEFMFN